MKPILYIIFTLAYVLNGVALSELYAAHFLGVKYNADALHKMFVFGVFGALLTSFYLRGFWKNIYSSILGMLLLMLASTSTISVVVFIKTFTLGAIKIEPIISFIASVLLFLLILKEWKRRSRHLLTSVR